MWDDRGTGKGSVAYRRYRGAEYRENGLDGIGTEMVETVETVDSREKPHVKCALENKAP
jgi:hypothetical protein